MSQEIAKSSEILEKEALIKDLQSQLKKKKTALKSLKTRLVNTKNSITEIQRAGNGQVLSKMSEMEKIRLEILELVLKMRKIRNLSRADKAVLNQIEQSFADEDMFGEDFKAYREQMNRKKSPEFDENERAKMRDIFETFAVKPTKEEQKNIRKVFISLSQKFHPDKAPTKADETEYHLMMQKINGAYQAGDIQTLLELERLFLTENLDLTKVQSLTVDVLVQEIERLERDLQFIDNQLNRNRSELKNLRASDLGKMLANVKKAEKGGTGMNAALEQLDDSIEHLKLLSNTFTKCIQLGNTKPLDQLLSAGQVSQSTTSKMRNEELNTSDLADMFGNGEDEDEADLFAPYGLNDLAIKNAKFEEGASVKIGKRNIDAASGIDLSGLIGRIVKVYHGVDEYDVLYKVELDSLSLNKLPLPNVEGMVNRKEDFQNFELREKHLKKCQARDTQKAAHAAYRQNLHRYLWNYEDDATQRRLQSILLQNPSFTDWENWQLFLNKKLNFPIAVKSRGMMDFKRGDKLRIIKLDGYNEKVGLIVAVVYRTRPGSYPLYDLLADTKNKEIKQIFEDYLIWAEEMYDLSQF